MKLELFFSLILIIILPIALTAVGSFLFKKSHFNEKPSKKEWNVFGLFSFGVGAFLSVLFIIIVRSMENGIGLAWGPIGLVNCLASGFLIIGLKEKFRGKRIAKV
jgi:hypothetical protein